MGTCTTGGASGGLAGAFLKKPETKNRQTSDNIPTASHTEILTPPETPPINPESLRAGHERLSAQRVEDTLLAESAADTARLIEQFRKSKSEHNIETLTATLRLDGEPLNAAIRQLVEVGFLESLRDTWKVPMLYRDGLDVRQGKAFAPDQPGFVDE